MPSTDPGFVDRILLTRVLSPAFDHCDVYMPDFLSETAIVGDAVVGWERATHSDLQSWVGFEVPQGVQQENGTEYEFQMWVRRC
jgi:dihydrofolate reductase